jgi:hypothetical protein
MKNIILDEVRCILLGDPVGKLSRRFLRYILIVVLNCLPSSILNRISSRVWQDEAALLWLESKISSISSSYIPERHGFIYEFMESDGYRKGAHVIEFGAGTADIAKLVNSCDPNARISGVNLSQCPSYASYGEHIIGGILNTIRLIEKSDVSLFISLGSLMYITRSELKEVFTRLKSAGASILLLEPHVATRFGLRPNPFCFNHDYPNLLQSAGFSIVKVEVIYGDARTKLIRLIATSGDS